MAVTTGTLQSYTEIKPPHDETGLCVAQVNFTISGTYAQANGSQLTGVGAFIASQRRDGRTVTIISAMLSQPAFDVTNATPGLLLCAYNLAVSGDNITFNISESATAGVVDVTDQYADATALPSLGSPMGFFVSYTVSPAAP